MSAPVRRHGAAEPADGGGTGRCARALRWLGYLVPFRRRAPVVTISSVVPATPQAEAAELAPAARAPGETEPAATATPGDDVADIRILPFILLHRSRMHAVDLRRALDGFRAGDGTLALRRGEVRNRTAYRLDVMAQVAVELVLGGTAVQERLTVDPEFRQVVHDAVYYVSRHWPDERPVDLTGENGRAAFAAYIRQRLDDAAAGEGAQRTATPLTDVEIDFLFDKAAAVARLLSNRRDLRLLFKAEWRGYMDDNENEVTKQLLVDTMNLGGSVAGLAPPLYSLEPAPLVYRWRYDRSGRALPLPVGVELPDAEGDPEPDARFVREFRRELAAAVQGDGGTSRERVDLATLASEFHVLASSPPWSEVERAINALLAPDRPGGAERRVLGPAVQQFADMLRERHEVLVAALFAGAAVGQAASGPPEERLARGLRTLSDAHRFAALGTADLADALRRVREGLSRVIPEGATEPPLPALPDDRSVAAWGRVVGEGLARVRAAPLDAEALHRAASESARRRMAAYLARGVREEPRVEELMVAASAGDAAAPLKLDIDAMTLGDWSALAYDALVAGGPAPWLGLAALAAVGFRARRWADLADWLERTRFLRKPEPIVHLEGLPEDEPPQLARAAVVIRRAEGSMTRGWTPRDTTPALVLTAEQATAIVQHLSPRRFKPAPLLPPLGTIAFEMPLDQPDADTRLLNLLRKRTGVDHWQVANVVYLYPDRPTDAARGPYVPAPRGLDDIPREPTSPRT